MLFFFAFNSANIITMSNIKLNMYPDEKAYLLVRGTPTVSYDLVDDIRKCGIFEQVMVIDMPVVDIKKVKFHKTKLLKYFSKRDIVYKYYNEFLDSNIEDNVCDILFIHGGWNEACYVAEYFYNINKKLEIRIVEEGTGIYSQTRKHLLKMRPGYSKKQLLASHVAEHKYLKHCYAALSDKIYVYSKDEYMRINDDKSVDIIELPCVDNNNNVLAEVVKNVCNIDSNLRIIYEKKKVIFLADYVYEDEQIILLQSILKEINARAVAVKVHTGCTAHKLNFAKQLKQKYGLMYVDRNTYFFEGLNMSVDFSEKVFVSRGSAVMLYMKLIYGKEPYLIFTYKLYKEYKNQGDVNRVGDLVDMIRNLYNDKGRIMVPDSMSQYEQMVENAYIQSLGY